MEKEITYDDFKEAWLKTNSLQGQNALLEQIYGINDIYWHASNDNLTKFAIKEKKYPIFLASDINFYFEPNLKFNVLKSNSRQYIYAIKFNQMRELFDPRNTDDIAKVNPMIEQFASNISNDTERKKFLLAWNGYLKTGNWTFIEYEPGSPEQGMVPNRALYIVLWDKAKYDGFVCNTEYTENALGIFDPGSLTIVKKFTKQEFIDQFYDSYKHNNMEKIADETMLQALNSELYEKLILKAKNSNFMHGVCRELVESHEHAPRMFF